MQLAYGVKGRIKHLVDAAREEANQPPKAGRPPKFLLPPIPGDARERFTLGLLALKLADERSTATHTETENESKSSEITVLTRVDPSVEAQMAVLFERVPSAWTRQPFQPLGVTLAASFWGERPRRCVRERVRGRFRGRGRGRKRGRSRNHMERGRYLRDGGRARTFSCWVASRVLGRAARRRPRLPTRAARPRLGDDARGTVNDDVPNGYGP